jgi:hypothetical protein
MKVDYLISLFKQTKNLILLTLYSNSIFQWNSSFCLNPNFSVNHFNNQQFK